MNKGINGRWLNSGSRERLVGRRKMPIVSSGSRRAIISNQPMSRALSQLTLLHSLRGVDLS